LLCRSVAFHSGSYGLKSDRGSLVSPNPGHEPGTQITAILMAGHPAGATPRFRAREWNRLLTRALASLTNRFLVTATGATRAGNWIRDDVHFWAWRIASASDSAQPAWGVTARQPTCAGGNNGWRRDYRLMTPTGPALNQWDALATTARRRRGFPIPSPAAISPGDFTFFRRSEPFPGRRIEAMLAPHHQGQNRATKHGFNFVSGNTCAGTENRSVIGNPLATGRSGAISAFWGLGIVDSKSGKCLHCFLLRRS